MHHLFTHIVLSLLFILNLSAQAVVEEVKEHKVEPRPMLYPFDVTIGGQKATMMEGNQLFAVIENPVKPDALLEIKKVVPMLIINAFAVKENGAVMEAGEQPVVYFVKDSNKVKLSETMDKKPLKPGRYLINVVANGATSRVVFLVEGGDGAEKDLKVPSVKQVFDFLTK